MLTGNRDLDFQYRKNTFLFRVICTTHKSVGHHTFEL
jgi:hypothetical protein